MSEPLRSHAHLNFPHRNLIQTKTKLAAVPRNRFARLRRQYIAHLVSYPAHFFSVSVLLVRAEIFSIYWRPLEVGYRYYYIYTTKNTFRATIFLYSPCHYMRAWIRVLEAPVCSERAARAGGEKIRTIRLRIDQNCRAVCTKKSSLNASNHSYS